MVGVKLQQLGDGHHLGAAGGEQRHDLVLARYLAG